VGPILAGQARVKYVRISAPAALECARAALIEALGFETVADFEAEHRAGCMWCRK
jgi:hypothetical protein